MKILERVSCLLSLFIFNSCVTGGLNSYVLESEGMILDGEVYTKENIEYLGGITHWYCTDYWDSSRILLEVGYFNKYESIGFILFDGTNEGTKKDVYFNREGLDFRWNWGLDKDGRFKYSFIIEPDGSAIYYHFLEGEHTAK